MRRVRHSLPDTTTGGGAPPPQMGGSAGPSSSRGNSGSSSSDASATAVAIPSLSSSSSPPPSPATSTATSRSFPSPIAAAAPRLRRASRLHFDMVVARHEYDSDSCVAGPSNSNGNSGNNNSNSSSSVGRSGQSGSGSSGGRSRRDSGPVTSNNAHTSIRAPATSTTALAQNSSHAPQSASTIPHPRPILSTSLHHSRQGSLDSSSSRTSTSRTSLRSKAPQRRSTLDLFALETPVTSLVEDEVHSRAASPTGSFTSAIATTPGGLDEGNPRSSMSHLTHRRLSLALEPATTRSSSLPHSPPLPPPDEADPALSTAIAGPSRSSSNGFSWFATPADNKHSKSDDGYATDTSDDERRGASSSSHRAKRKTKGLLLTPVPQASELPVDPNNLLPLSASPSILDDADLVTTSSPRTSMSSGWGTRSFSSSSSVEDDGSPTHSSYLLRPPEDDYPTARRRSPRTRPSWFTGLLGRFAKSNTASPAQEYLRHRKRLQLEKLEQRDGITTRRRRQKVLGSQYLAIALHWLANEPWKIVLFFAFLLIFGICLGCTIKYNLDPDNMALPWREYCTSSHPTLYHIPSSSIEQSSQTLPELSPLAPITPEHRLWPYQGYSEAPFSSDINGSRVDDSEPVSIFLAIFTFDAGRARRDLIRRSYNTHPRSRTPGTEGVRLRFLMGQPRPHLAHAVEQEQAEHGDIVMLDMEENMNSGKTHEFFSWAASHATVPDYEYPSHPRSEASKAEFDLATSIGEEPKPIYRGEKTPDFIAKADDDAFLMLGEFERHLRVVPKTKSFWGYLVRELFMAGECYAMSHDLAVWIRDNKVLNDYTHGKEDKLVSRWLRMHPQAEDIVWATEHCWIYDHPKGGTVYSHGFLYPSEVASVRQEQHLGIPSETREYRQKFARNPDAYSTVTRFGARYRPPVKDLSEAEQVEALVEGSELSKITGRPRRSAISAKVDTLMASKPTRSDRFLNSDHGGTVIVHYIKKHEWFKETIAAMLT